MENDVIDDFTEDSLGNKPVIFRIVLLLIISVAVLLCTFVLRPYFPTIEIASEDLGEPIETIGILLCSIHIFISRFLTALLVKIKGPLRKSQVILYGGLVYFLLSVLYIFFQNIIFFNYGFNVDYTVILKMSLIMSSMGMLFVNVSFQRIKKKSVYSAIGIAIIGLMILGYLFN